MSDGHDLRDGRGVQAYRWVMLAGVAALGFMVTKVYEKIDKTADTVGTIERSITALNGRLDSHADRLSDHDRRIGRLETPYFRGFERATP